MKKLICWLKGHRWTPRDSTGWPYWCDRCCTDLNHFTKSATCVFADSQNKMISIYKKLLEDRG